MSTPSPPRWCWIAVAILLGCPPASSSRSPGLVDDEGFDVQWTPMRIEGWRPDFPEEMFTSPHVAAAAKISDFRPPGAAWGQHVVLMVFTILDDPMK